MLALLSYYEVAGGEKYLDVVKQLGEWVAINCTDEKIPKGYTGGYEGWEASSKNPSGQKKLTYKATEHNIDLYSAFNRLYRITKDEKWHQRAEFAKGFVLAMWDDKDGKFWTGSNEDGISINKDNVPVDIQAWAVEALFSDNRKYWEGLKYAEKHHEVSGGFDFNEDKDGIWYEGTGQMAVAYCITGQSDKWRKVLNILKDGQHLSGALPSASLAKLTTGFNLPNSTKPWLYFDREHVGASAWFALAQYGLNPFYIMQPGKQKINCVGL